MAPPASPLRLRSTEETRRRREQEQEQEQQLRREVDGESKEAPPRADGEGSEQQPPYQEEKEAHDGGVVLKGSAPPPAAAAAAAAAAAGGGVESKEEEEEEGEEDGSQLGSEAEAEQELVEPAPLGSSSSCYPHDRDGDGVGAEASCPRPLPPLPPSLSAKLHSPAHHDFAPPPPPYSPSGHGHHYHDGSLSLSRQGPPGLGASNHGPPHHQHGPLSVSFGPGTHGGGPGTMGGLRTGKGSILSRAASLLTPAASTSLRLFILVAITWSATMTTCLGPFFPIYMRDKFHASSMLIGLVFSVTSFSQFLACPVVAPFSHQFSRVAALKTGLLVLCAGGLIFGVLDHPAGFIFGRILQGIGNGFVEVAGLSLLMSYSKDLKRDVGWMEGASSVGFLIGPMLGGFLSSALGFRTLFLIMSLPNAAMVALLTFAPRLILPRGGDPHLVDASQHSINASQHSVISISSINSYKGGPSAGNNQTQQTAQHPNPDRATASRRRRKAATLKRTGKAILSSPTLPLYILIVLVVAGALGFMDTALSEHLVTALGASTFTAGLLFTIQITVYVLFSFCAGQIAHRVGRWRAVVGTTLLWSAGMFALGPVPALAPYIQGRAAATALIVTTLGVLGCLETFIFLPFIPCFHHRFRARLGWRARETEDAVAAIWTTVFAMGQSIGPLVGGLLMDALPKTRELGCVVGQSPDVPDEGACYSAFPWASAAFGTAGFVCAGLLMLALARQSIHHFLLRLRYAPSTLLPLPPPTFLRVTSRPNSAAPTPMARTNGGGGGFFGGPKDGGVLSRRAGGPAAMAEDEEAGGGGKGAALNVSRGGGSVGGDSVFSELGWGGFGFGHEWEEEDEAADDEEWDDLECSRHGSVLPGRLVFSMSRLQVEAEEVEVQAAIDRSMHSAISGGHSSASSGGLRSPTPPPPPQPPHSTGYGHGHGHAYHHHHHPAAHHTPHTAPPQLSSHLRPGAGPVLRPVHPAAAAAAAAAHMPAVAEAGGEEKREHS